MNAFWTALFFVFLAEMGDKTQVVSMVFGAKYKLVTVLSAISTAVFLMLFLWVVLGEFCGHILPIFWVNIISGLLFIAFGIWTFIETEEGEPTEVQLKGEWGPFVTIAASFFVAELGDKTLLAAATIASQQHAFFQVWMGGSIGMIAADVLAIILGKLIGKQLPDKMIRYTSGPIFILCGLWTLWETIRHHV